MVSLLKQNRIIMIMVIVILSISFCSINTNGKESNKNDIKIIYDNPIVIDGSKNFNLSKGVIKGNGSYLNPYLIEGWNISNPNGHGIVIQNSDVYFIIRNCLIRNCHSGILFSNVSNGIIDCNFITYNRIGIEFDGGVGSRACSYFNIISNNIICFNKENGIQFDHTLSGHHSGNIIKYNNITSNNDYGISLDMCMGGGDHNLVYGNNFIKNNLNGNKQAYNGGGNNSWNYNNEGNFWDDWIDPDNDSNGIIDNPYLLGYSSYDNNEIKDNYPLKHPIKDAGCKKYLKRLPVIIINVSTQNGTIPLNITFNGLAIDIDGYIENYYWDFGDENFSYDQNTSNIYIKPGNYTVLFKVMDNEGHQKSDYVKIEVFSNDTDSDGYNDTIDSFPENPSEWIDTDKDGIGNNEDLDDDNDGYFDDWEKFYNTDPFDFNETPLDTDKDCEPDGDSVNSESWMDLDDDNDGIPDNWEIQYGLNPINSSDAIQDSDNDSFTNKEEYELNTNPTDQKDPLKDELRIDNDEESKAKKKDYTIFLVLGIIVIIILLLLGIFIFRKMKRG